MYWYMTTKIGSQVLLSDGVWARLPPTTPDRRAVGAALLAFVLMVATVVVAGGSGVIAPRLSYEGGSSTATNSNTRARAHGPCGRPQRQGLAALADQRRDRRRPRRGARDADVGRHRRRPRDAHRRRSSPRRQLRGDGDAGIHAPDGATTSSSASSACSAFPRCGSTACSTISCSRLPAGGRADSALIANGTATAFPYSSTRR